jgi:hypothetical protein
MNFFTRRRIEPSVRGRKGLEVICLPIVLFLFFLIIKIKKSIIGNANLGNNAIFYLRFFAAPLRALREVS